MKPHDLLRSEDRVDPNPVFQARRGPRLAVIIPSFRATGTIGGVLRAIGPEVEHIYVVDDGCPDRTGERALRDNRDPRVVVLRNQRNLGVGGAMKRGYARALADGA